MIVEKVIKREDGTQFLVRVYYCSEMRESEEKYLTSVATKKKGKRKWLDLDDTIHEYQYRALSMEDRALHTYNNVFRFVSKEELLEVKLELWNKMKPTL